MDNWGARSVLGEKYWSERKKNPVPQHHNTPVRLLTMMQIIGTIVLAIGLWKLDPTMTIAGTITVYMSKMWFLDRMVWVFKDMQSQ